MEAGDYDILKEAILNRYDITDESYRQRFRNGKRAKDESNRELVVRLNDLVTKWLESKKSREEVLDQIVFEQFLKTLPDDVRVFVRERSPGTSEEAAKLADSYLQARKEDLANKELNRKEGDKSRRCLRCGKIGHVAKDCRVDLSKSLVKGQGKEVPPARSGEKYKKERKEIECFNCGKKGHIAMHCPSKSLFCGTRFGGAVTRKGRMDGKEVSDILLDTGCSRTMV